MVKLLRKDFSEEERGNLSRLPSPAIYLLLLFVLHANSGALRSTQKG